MKTFKQHLIEGLSPILYHSTNFISAANILENDYFKLAADVGTQSELELSKPSKYYYMSTTRHKLGGYSLSIYDRQTMLVLDGKKLGARYKGAAVDYWSNDSVAELRGRESKEAEDRIYHTKPIIKKASSYIKEIHVMLDRELGEYEVKESQKLRTLYKLSLKKKIPIYFYYDKGDYLVLNKKKSVKIDLSSLQVRDYPGDGRINFPELNPFAEYEELYYTPKSNEKKLSKKASKLLYDLKFGINSYQVENVRARLRNDIHNYKKDPKKIEKIIKIFKKERIKEPIEFLKVLIDKWGIWNR